MHVALREGVGVPGAVPLPLRDGDGDRVTSWVTDPVAPGLAVVEREPDSERVAEAPSHAVGVAVAAPVATRDSVCEAVPLTSGVRENGRKLPEGVGEEEGDPLRVGVGDGERVIVVRDQLGVAEMVAVDGVIEKVEGLSDHENDGDGEKLRE